MVLVNGIDSHLGDLDLILTETDTCMSRGDIKHLEKMLQENVTVEYVQA